MEGSKLFTNKHISTFGDRAESGVVGNSERFDVYTRTINTDKWGGRNVNFQVNNLSFDRLIVGDRCFIAFRCTALDSAGDLIADTDIELRDGVGNLIIETLDVKIGGVSVHSDGYAGVTRHFYEHLNNPNSSRISREHLDRYIGDEQESFGNVDPFHQQGGIFNEAIKVEKEFTIIRPLDDVTFFGSRDSTIPASLPITIDTRLNSKPARCFNCVDTVTDSPLLYIIEAELYILSVQLEDSYAAMIQEGLATDALAATADSWHSMSLGTNITAGNTSYRSSDGTLIETTPDILGIALMPSSSYNSSTPYKGRHPYTTTWNSTEKIDIRTFGRPLREYRHLGFNTYVGQKAIMFREVHQIAGGNVQAGLGNAPIDADVYAKGHLSFFPSVFRDISESTVLKPKPTSITFDLTMSNSSVNAVVQLFYKVRHQWKLSLQSGGTMIMK